MLIGSNPDVGDRLETAATDISDAIPPGARPSPRLCVELWLCRGINGREKIHPRDRQLKPRVSDVRKSSELNRSPNDKCRAIHTSATCN